MAPVKTITIPHLELCAAVLLARLLRYVISNFGEAHLSSVYSWTDSKIVLAWLRSDPSRWEVSVANRVAEIHRTLPDVTWSHVRSNQNPADIASRGLLPSELENSSLWWSGPAWIRLPEEQWPSSLAPIVSDSILQNIDATESLPRIGLVTCLTSTLQLASEDPFTRFSSLLRLERVIARCLRFRHRLSDSDRLQERGSNFPRARGRLYTVCFLGPTVILQTTFAV